MEGMAQAAAAEAAGPVPGDDQHRKQRAARLFGAAAALREAIGAPLPPVEHAAYDRSVAALRAALPEAAFAAAWAEGRRMTVDQAIDTALETD
jgi:hypothetical protein